MVVFGRAIVVDVKVVLTILDLRVSPLGLVEEPKFRSIPELFFADGTTFRSSMNDDTYFAQAPVRVAARYARYYVTSTLLEPTV